jgi:hypothetical protein
MSTVDFKNFIPNPVFVHMFLTKDSKPFIRHVWFKILIGENSKKKKKKMQINKMEAIKNT